MRQFFLLALLTVSIGLMAAEPVVKVKYDSTFTGRGNAAELLFDAVICPQEAFFLESLELDSKMTSPDHLNWTGVFVFIPFSPLCCSAL